MNVTWGDGSVIGRRGESAPRREGEVAALRPRRDRVAGGAGLVLALVGEQRAVVDVADAVEPALRDGLAVLVHDAHAVVDSQPVSVFDAEGVQPETAGAGDMAGRDEQLIRLDGGAVVQLETEPAAVAALDRGGRRVQVQGRAEFAQGGGHRLAGERFVPAEEAAAGDEVDLGTESGVRGRHLRADHPATEDRERRRNPLCARRVAAGPRPGVAQPGDVRQQCGRARAYRAACFAVSTLTAPSSSVTVTSRGAVIVARPRTRSMPALVSQSTWPSSFQALVMTSRRFSTVV